MTDLLEFDEVEPDIDCICAGCTSQRGAGRRAASVRGGGHTSSHSARRRAAVLFAAVGAAVGGTVAGAVAAPVPGRTSSTPAPGTLAPNTPQGEVAGRFGGAAAPGDARPQAAQRVTREQIIARAQGWVDQKVPYSMSTYWTDGYRQDCSGFVSMAWGLATSETTWTLPNLADRITKAELEPGDVLIFNNAANPQAGSHVTVFGGWIDASRTSYLAYEQTSPATTRRTTPYAYWSNSASYLPYRFRALSPAGAGASSDGATLGTAFPGADKFAPGQSNEYVTRLGRMLVQRGGARFYTEGPGPAWGEADRRATEAFQLAQGWKGAEADGYPGRDTWDHLVNGTGKDIAAAAVPTTQPPATTPPPATPPDTTTTPAPATTPVPATTPPPPAPAATPATTPPAVTALPDRPGAGPSAPGRSEGSVQQLG